MLLMTWIVVFCVLAVPYSIYYARFQKDLAALTGIDKPMSLKAFFTGHLDDPGLERRRRIAAYTGAALTVFGLIGFVIPSG